MGQQQQQQQETAFSPRGRREDSIPRGVTFIFLQRKNVRGLVTPEIVRFGVSCSQVAGLYCSKSILSYCQLRGVIRVVIYSEIFRFGCPVTSYQQGCWIVLQEQFQLRGVIIRVVINPEIFLFGMSCSQVAGLYCSKSISYYCQLRGVIRVEIYSEIFRFGVSCSQVAGLYCRNSTL